VRLAPFVALSSCVCLVGCILFVNEGTPDGDQFSTMCALLDSTSACGACVASSCANQITACCADTTCKSALSQFDTCADAGICTVDLSSATASALASCMNSTCSACDVVPESGDGSAPGTVDVNCGAVAGFGYCSCEADEPGSKPYRCDQTSIPNSVCCADDNYPTNGSCSCMPIKCDENIGPGGCSCSPDQEGNVSSCDISDGPCCMDEDGTCTCEPDNDEACDQFSTPVDDCTLAKNVGCSSSQKWYTSCSLEAN
jgi:hypothetical protein